MVCGGIRVARGLPVPNRVWRRRLLTAVWLLDLASRIWHHFHQNLLFNFSSVNCIRIMSLDEICVYLKKSSNARELIRRGFPDVGGIQ